MELRNWIGVVLLIGGVSVLLPDWTSFPLQVASVGLIFLGAMILIIQHRIDAAEKKEFELRSSGEAASQNNQGGRSDRRKSSSMGDFADGGDGGGD